MILSLISLAMADIPAGSTIEQAASIDIPPDGFTAVSSFITEIIPESIPVDGEDIQVPIVPVQQASTNPPKQPRKTRKHRRKKKPKLPGAQKQKGYNQIN